jgi:hypothetical protein
MCFLPVAIHDGMLLSITRGVTEDDLDSITPSKHDLDGDPTNYELWE